jgi:hypothetical protein
VGRLTNPSLILVGPQAVRPDLGAALRAGELRGPVALITAGWQEREGEDQALVAELGVEAVNLTLHARSEQVFAADRELARVYRERQARLTQMHDLYRIRLDHGFEAEQAIAARRPDPELLAEEQRASVATLRHHDADHLHRLTAVQAAFEQRWHPSDRPEVARQRRELQELIEPTRTVVVAGGHVASLLYRLKLFDIAALVGDRPWVAAAAGAMVLTERIYIFHDFPPHGTGIAELLDAGLGLARNLVVLPDPRRRLRLDDRAGIGRFVQRVAPADCVALDDGARLVVERHRATRAFDRSGLPDGAVIRLFPDGSTRQGWKP